MNRADAELLGGMRSLRWTGCPSIKNLPVVRLIDAGKKLDQSRFSGAIFADEHMHFAGNRSKLTSSSATTPGKRFETFEQLEQARRSVAG